MYYKEIQSNMYGNTLFSENKRTILIQSYLSPKVWFDTIQGVRIWLKKLRVELTMIDGEIVYQNM